MTKQEVLQLCRVDGLMVYLPDIKLDRKLYQEVAKALELIGGKWKGGKIMGFVFTMDPTDLVESIASGEQINLQKKYQFFATPPDIADWLVQLAELESGELVLEPSAGQGAIVEAIQRHNANQPIVCVEIMAQNSLVLTKKQITHFFQDFLTSECNHPFHKIIANPPFSNNQDIDHIYKMVEVCKPGGRIVTVASRHWEESKNKKETEFRDFLEGMKADIRYISPGTFKESGTMVGACIIIINN